MNSSLLEILFVVSNASLSLNNQMVVKEIVRNIHFK